MRILVPVDLSGASAALVRHAARIASRTGGELTLLHVYGGEAAATALREEGLFIDLYVGRLRSELRYLQVQAGAMGRRAPVEVVGGDAAAVIARRARELGIDLVIMGTHGRTGLPRLLIGSVAEEVVRRASCPVLLVPTSVLAEESQGGAAMAVAQ